MNLLSVPSAGSAGRPQSKLGQRVARARPGRLSSSPTPNLNPCFGHPLPSTAMLAHPRQSFAHPADASFSHHCSIHLASSYRLRPTPSVPLARSSSLSAAIRTFTRLAWELPRPTGRSRPRISRYLIPAADHLPAVHKPRASGDVRPLTCSVARCSRPFNQASALDATDPTADLPSGNGLVFQEGSSAALVHRTGLRKVRLHAQASGSRPRPLAPAPRQSICFLPLRQTEQPMLKMFELFILFLSDLPVSGFPISRRPSARRSRPLRVGPSQPEESRCRAAARLIAARSARFCA